MFVGVSNRVQGWTGQSKLKVTAGRSLFSSLNAICPSVNLRQEVVGNPSAVNVSMDWSSKKNQELVELTSMHFEAFSPNM